jgi:predicted metal-dependent phosphoesterase TrpH
MLYRFDLHVHSFFSGDASNSPEQLIAAARAKGLSGIAITDHNSCESAAYCLEHGLSNSAGTPVDGFLVVPGVEVSTADGHLLCIGTTLPQMLGKPAFEVEKKIMDRGGVAIPAHPYDRWRAGIREEVLVQMRTPVIEAFNAAVTSRAFNAQARAFAMAHGRQMTAGSDAHHASAVGTADTGYELDEFSVAGLVRAIVRGGVMNETYLSRTEGFKKQFGNWFRAFNRNPAKPKH